MIEENYIVKLILRGWVVDFGGGWLRTNAMGFRVIVWHHGPLFHRGGTLYGSFF